MGTEKCWIFSGRSKKLKGSTAYCNFHFISEVKFLTSHLSLPKLCMQYFSMASLSLSLLVFVYVGFEEP